MSSYTGKLFSDVSQSTVLANGATTARTLGAMAGDVLNAQSFLSGGTDYYTAILAAHDALPNGGIIELPRGQLACSATPVFTNSNIWLRGQGTNGTILIVPNSAGVHGLQQGNSTTTVVNNRVSDMTIQSEATSSSAPVSGTIGIYWGNFNNGFEDNVRVRLFDIGRCWDYLPGGSLSISYHATVILADSCVTAYDKQAAAAGVFIDNLEYGINGSDLYNPTYGTIFAGSANDHKKFSGEIIPRAGTSFPTIAIWFENYTQSADALIEYGMVHLENIASLAGSDANTPLITTLCFRGTTSETGSGQFVFNSATLLKNLNIQHPNWGGGVTAIANVEWLSITGGFIQELNLTGSGTGNSATVVGTNVGSGVLAGTFGQFSLIGCPAVLTSWSGSITCTYQRITGCNGLVDMVPVGAVQFLTVGTSPFTFTMPASGTIQLAGGTITNLNFYRNGTNTTYPPGVSIFPGVYGDQLEVQYSAAPQMFFVPT